MGAGNQGCAIAGAQPGSTQVSGTDYLSTALDFSVSHKWRNFGIVLAFWIFFVTLCMITIERLPAAGSNKAILLYKRGGGGKFIRASQQNGTGPKDVEEGKGEKQVVEKSGGKGDPEKAAHKSEKGKGGEKKANKEEDVNSDVHAENTYVSFLVVHRGIRAD